MADVEITIGAAIEGLLEGVNKANEAVKGLAESVKVLGSAFAIREIYEFIESMAEAGEQIERTADILGVSTTAAQELSTMSRITGGSADQMTLSLERLQLNLQRGQQLTSAQAAALKTFGLTAKEVTAVPVDKQVDLFADSFKRLTDQGLNPVNALILLFGRGAAGLAPLLREGSDGVQEWRQRMIDAGAIISKLQDEQLSGLSRALNLTGAAIKGLAESIVAAFSPSLTRMANEIAAASGNLMALISTGNLANYVMDYLDAAVDKLGARFAQLGIVLTNLATGHWSDALTYDMERAAAAADDAGKRIEEVNKRYTEIAKAFRDQLSGEGAGLKAAPIDLGAGAAQKDALKIAQDNFKTAEQNINALRDSYQISEEQKTEMLKAQLAIRANAEIQAGENTRVAYAKMNADIAKLDTQATKEFFDAWKGVADTIANTFTSQLDSILSGTETFAEGMRKVFATMIEDMIALLVRLFTEWLTLDLISQAIGGGPIPFSAVLPKAFNIPGHAVGTPYVTNTGPAFLHEGEAVLSAEQNPFGPTGNSGSVLGGGANVTLNVSAIDAKSFQALLLENQGPLAMALKTMIRNNVGLLSQIGQGAR